VSGISGQASGAACICLCRILRWETFFCLLTEWENCKKFLFNNVAMLLFGYMWLVVILGMMERRARELVLCVSNADKGSLTSELY
jgi:hypothetical protein